MGISMGPDGGKEKMSDKEKIVKLEQENKELKESLFDVWMLLSNYHDFYDVRLKKGDPHSLAELIDDALTRIRMPSNKALDQLVVLDEELGLYDDYISEEKK